MERTQRAADPRTRRANPDCNAHGKHIERREQIEHNRTTAHINTTTVNNNHTTNNRRNHKVNSKPGSSTPANNNVSQIGNSSTKPTTWTSEKLQVDPPSRADGHIRLLVPHSPTRNGNQCSHPQMKGPGTQAIMAPLRGSDCVICTAVHKTPAPTHPSTLPAHARTFTLGASTTDCRRRFPKCRYTESGGAPDCTTPACALRSATRLRGQLIAINRTAAPEPKPYMGNKFTGGQLSGVNPDIGNTSGNYPEQGTPGNTPPNPPRTPQGPSGEAEGPPLASQVFQIGAGATLPHTRVALLQTPPVASRPLILSPTGWPSANWHSSTRLVPKAGLPYMTLLEQSTLPAPSQCGPPPRP